MTTNDRDPDRWLITNGVDACSDTYDLGQGYQLAWGIGPDGEAWPMIADTRITEPSPMASCPEHFRELAPHELTGKLPLALRQEFRPHCGAPTRHHTACRNEVANEGDRCSWHQQTQPALDGL